MMQFFNDCTVPQDSHDDIGDEDGDEGSETEGTNAWNADRRNDNHYDDLGSGDGKLTNAPIPLMNSNRIPSTQVRELVVFVERTARVFGVFYAIPFVCRTRIRVYNRSNSRRTCKTLHRILILRILRHLCYRRQRQRSPKTIKVPL